MTTKLLETSEAGGRPSAADVAELLYPLRRARQFAYQYRGYSERSSYRELEGALDAYEKLVEEVDAARSDDQRWAAIRDGVLTSADGVREQLQRTQMALERET